MPVPTPSTIDLIEALDDLMRELHRLPVDHRRKLVTGLTHRLVNESGTGLRVVVVDRLALNNTLAELLDQAVSLARIGLADPETEVNVIDSVVARVVEMAADFPGRDAKRLAMWVERVARWS